jgi:ABC-type multidrug transport system fused ATPase/permease subunit
VKSLTLFMQAGVSLNRIAVFLDEEEVTDQVSSLKKDHSAPYLPDDEEGFGFEKATFTWNKVVDVVEKGKESSSKLSSSPIPSEVADEASVTECGEREHVFELRDITLRFPEGELTVVTGPTASGKTALLVCHSNSLVCLRY